MDEKWKTIKDDGLPPAGEGRGQAPGADRKVL